MSGGIKEWGSLAWKEFWLPFCYWRRGGCPGGRDFLWLTSFMTVILILFLLLLGSREGLLNRLVDVFLGNIPEHGVPVLTMKRPGTRLMDKIGKMDVEAHPFRIMEATLNPPISLPGEKVWANITDQRRKFGPDFDGWAVYSQDPLWNQDISFEDFPLRIILSRALFKKYFHYRAYRTALKGNIPDSFFQKIPDEIDLDADTPLQTLWLNVNIGLKRELAPFSITWVNRIPVVEKIAYLFPLATHGLLTATRNYPELVYFPELHGEKGQRIRQISFLDEGDIDEFRTKLQGEVRDLRGKKLLTLKRPLPEEWIAAYAEEYGINFKAEYRVWGDIITGEKEKLYIPCSRISDDELDLTDLKECDTNSDYMIEIDMTAKGRDFYQAMVYIPDRTLISDTIAQLVPLVTISPVYQDALNRFGFMSKMIEVMKLPYALFLALFIIVLLGILMSILIGHRRHRYGIFLSKGLKWWGIYFMLWFQSLLSVAIGTILSISILQAGRAFLNYTIQTVAVEYKDTLDIHDLNLLPLHFFDYIAASIIVLITVWLLTTIILFFMPLRRRTYPAILLQD